MNDEIRKNNQLKNEKMKHKLKNENGDPVTSAGMPFNMIPWGVDQTQFQQQTIDKSSIKSIKRAGTPSPFRQSLRGHSKDSTSKSDKGALGMDFLEFKPKNKKRSKKRKVSYQNIKDEKRIEIEEKDSIEVQKNKVSYEQIKKTVIYNKTERNKDSKEYKRLKKNSKKHTPDQVKNLNKHGDSIIKITFPQKQSKSRSTSKNRPNSMNSHKDIYSFIEDKNKLFKMKQAKDYLKIKKENLKIKKQLNDLNSYVSKKYKNDVYNDRTYDGALPQHISKKLKSKQRSKSKTPRSFKDKNKLINFEEPAQKKSNVRPSTGGGFYPITSRGSNTPFNISPRLNITKPNSKEVSQSYDKPLQRFTAEKKHTNIKNSVSQTKFKINPSPFKRREKSINQLLEQVDTGIKELEILHNKSKKQIQSIKQKSKHTKKKKKKARSHSPEGIAQQIKNMGPASLQYQILKAIQKNVPKLNKAKGRRHSKVNITSRNKKTN